MKLWSNNFKNNETIPTENCFGKWNPDTKCDLTGGNKNPHMAWSELPEGTKSLALVCCDNDVPTESTNVNKEGMTVAADLPRTNFYHWVVLNIDPTVGEITEGQFSSGITKHGKGPDSPIGTLQGINNYTQWFKGDSEMEGTYFGYDGPCPPWNDELGHNYTFTLYALSTETCSLEGEFTPDQAIEWMKENTLGTVKLTGKYAINPNAKFSN